MTAQLVIAAALLLALLASAAVVYHGLVRRRNRVDATWSDIDVLLRRRHDLIANLVATVQGYSRHESATMLSVSGARAAAMTAEGPDARGDAEATLGGGVKTLIAEAEAYPDLKASDAFVRLQGELTSTEDGLAHARQFYNDSVFGYNNAVQTLPGSLLAGAMGFHARQFFQAAAGDRVSVQVPP